MNNELHPDLLEAIAELRRRYPQLRFGQLIANIAGWADQDLWDVEDEQLLAAAQLHLQQLTSSKVTLSGQGRNRPGEG